jgi:hypothetical protein
MNTVYHQKCHTATRVQVDRVKWDEISTFWLQETVRRSVKGEQQTYQFARFLSISVRLRVCEFCTNARSGCSQIGRHS